MPTIAGRTRQRFTPIGKYGTFRVGTMYKRSTVNGSWVEDAPQPVASPQENWVSLQRVHDENHGRPPYRVGGPFKRLMIISSLPAYGEVIGGVDVMSISKLRRYQGGFKAPATADFQAMPGWATPTSPAAVKDAAFPDMSGVASEAWSRTKPKIQRASVAVGLFESIRETPDLLRHAAQRFRDIFSNTFEARVRRGWGPAMPKRVADDWMAGNFGWLPMVNEVSDIIDTTVRNGDLIRKLSEENGRSIRKQRLLEESTDERVIASGTGEIMLARSLKGVGGDDSFYRPGTQPSWEVVERLSVRSWAVGRFRYYRQEFDLEDPRYHSRLMAARRQLTLYGARITPSNLYAVVPWSWLGDWVSNAGSYVERASDYLADSLAAEYFYVMHHVKRERVFRNTFPFHSMGDVVVEATRVVETKQRVEASSPFGIDVSWDDLTPRQGSILAALGISRRGTFR